eukprot:scaffold113262_cov21-Tisochrysis_lutea.AAC.2
MTCMLSFMHRQTQPPVRVQAGWQGGGRAACMAKAWWLSGMTQGNSGHLCTCKQDGRAIDGKQLAGERHDRGNRSQA